MILNILFEQAYYLLTNLKEIKFYEFRKKNFPQNLSFSSIHKTESTSNMEKLTPAKKNPRENWSREN